MRRSHPLMLNFWFLLTFVFFAAVVFTGAHAQSSTVITWNELDPGFKARTNGKKHAERYVGQSYSSSRQSVLPLADPFDPLAAGSVVAEDWEESAFEIVSELLNARITIDGYVLPLHQENGRIIEFLLVPWVGACIHTPAPPPNQIIHVDYPEGFETGSMFTPVRLNGRLMHRPASHDLFLIDGSRSISTSYVMEQAEIGGTPGEIIVADSAVEDLPWFAATQARITDIFTTAMMKIEQGRSASAIGVALLIAFAYGALHTLGPGHGKAVVVSYFVGAGGSLSRGVVMGARIAAMHVLSAVILVFLLDFALRQATGAAPSDYRLIRLGSYGLIVAIGVVMLWRALASIRPRRADKSGVHGHNHNYGDRAHAGCTACAIAEAKPRGGGWIAAAIGVVPCTGALIVMLFGLANDLVIPAIMMVIAISAGMALAMSAIGIAAILGRNWAETRFGTNLQRRLRFEAAARIAGAACVLAIGSTLFAVTFAQKPSPEGLHQATVVESTYIASQGANQPSQH